MLLHLFIHQRFRARKQIIPIITNQYSEYDEYYGSVSMVKSVHEVSIPCASDLGNATHQSQREHDKVFD